MSEKASERPKVAAILRVVIGPPALLIAAALQGVRVTGPITLSLAHPAPPWSLILSDVLSVVVLATVAFWGASVVAGRRSPVAGFILPVAASQLPMAAAAVLVGRDIQGWAMNRALGAGGAEVLAAPGPALAPFVPAAIGVVVLTAVAAGILYVGYCRATRATGFRVALSFAGGLVAAEVLCRAWFLWTG